MDAAAAVRDLGGAATRRRLRDLGASDAELRAAVAAGVLARPRRGHYAIATDRTSVLRAVAIGGSVTCVTLLREAGVWVGIDDSWPHIVVPPSGKLHPRGAVLHWSKRCPAGPRDTVPGALRRLARCAGREMAVASVDSALRLGLLSASELAMLPRYLRDRADRRSESGSETLVRLRLLARGIDFAIQVPIDGVGRVDFLVGERLVIEVDGYSVHGSPEAFERDRARDLALAERGYLIIRVSHKQVIADWPRIERSLLRIVRSGRHRWPIGRARRILSGDANVR